MAPPQFNIVRLPAGRVKLLQCLDLSDFPALTWPRAVPIMPKMPEQQIRSAIDEIRTRLQAELDAQLTTLEERHSTAIDAARRAAAADVDARWGTRVEELRAEWDVRLKTELERANAAADERHAADIARLRQDIERHEAAVARERDEHIHQIAQERLRADAAAAALAAAQQSAEPLKAEIDGLSVQMEALRGELERASGASTEERVRAEALAQERSHLSDALEAERRRAADLEGEREALQSELAALRSTTEHDVTSARRQTEAAQHQIDSLRQQLDAARQELSKLREQLDSTSSELVHARERRAEPAPAAQSTEAVLDARVAERQSGLAMVERLLGAVRAIDGARSLTDALATLVQGAAAEAPRAAMFIVNGRHLQRWKSHGFQDAAAGAQMDVSAPGVLAEAVRRGEAVATSAAAAPTFAALPPDRAGLAVPVTVGGHAVAVLYADDGAADEPLAPASWPEAVQILTRHASTCVSHLTAVRTAQAMKVVQAPAAAAAPSAAGAAPSDDESGARRYARLLVSEIKLYNEAAVRDGRERRDLLTRLRPEIERARRLYEERVPPTVGGRGMYFQQELEQTLAGGDPGLLGTPPAH